MHIIFEGCWDKTHQSNQMLFYLSHAPNTTGVDLTVKRLLMIQSKKWNKINKNGAIYREYQYQINVEIYRKYLYQIKVRLYTGSTSTRSTTSTISLLMWMGTFPLSLVAHHQLLGLTDVEGEVVVMAPHCQVSDLLLVGCPIAVGDQA